MGETETTPVISEFIIREPESYIYRDTIIIKPLLVMQHSQMDKHTYTHSPFD